jgi:DNA polymerase
MAALRTAVLPCSKCQLHKGANQVVFGEGNPNARVLFVGEAPGEAEDDTGRPFVGPSGKLLDKIIEKAMGMRREDVFIANVNKCRPPENRDPEPLEIASCLPWLRDQIKIINPEVIVTLGRVAMWNLLGITDSMGRMRGKELDYEGIPVVATWHPAYLLRKPAAKADTWADIKRVNGLLGNPEVPTAENSGGQ